MKLGSGRTIAVRKGGGVQCTLYMLEIVGGGGVGDILRVAWVIAPKS
jgi:hypothetical protein